MAEKVKKYYTIDHKKKIITVDASVNPTKVEEKEVDIYTKNNYALRIKSQARAEKMKAKADGLDADAIKKALENDEVALKKFDDIIHGKKTGITNAEGKVGFFAAKKWYLKEYLPAKEKKEKK